MKKYCVLFLCTLLSSFYLQAHTVLKERVGHSASIIHIPNNTSSIPINHLLDRNQLKKSIINTKHSNSIEIPTVKDEIQKIALYSSLEKILLAIQKHDLEVSMWDN